MKKRAKNSKTLVIVESPTKTKSLAKFLGKSYRIESSKGHLIDLPKSSMGIDVENDFEPRYITIRGKGKTLSELKKAAKQAKEVLLATDPDREGEAISWHLERALLAVNENIKRIEFNEITKESVLSAVADPRPIDLQRVNSQQARRLLDRLVGYSISPILQEKFGSKRFSAGRVQSAALSIICAREKEIEVFKSKEYWEVEGTFNKEGGKKKDSTVIFKLAQVNKKKPDIGSQEEVDSLESEIRDLGFKVSKRKTSSRTIKPPAPYITSKLQQEASTRLGFRAQKTMSVAQGLYEGVELESGQTGLITYMRTDSSRISDAGLTMVRDYIKENFDEDYLPENPHQYGNKKAAQDAHEAIRPTDVRRTPQSVAAHLSKDGLKLYTLIWSRFVASQMTPGQDELVTIEIYGEKENSYMFRFSASSQKFAGFRKVFASGEAKNSYIPAFHEGESLNLLELEKIQKFTQPPPRYTEASLIKIMEESGIGRPATYVPTLITLDKRSYIERKGRQIIPTTLGRIVNDLMVDHFPDIVNLTFTSGMEEKLDRIAEGAQDWRRMLGDFFNPFKNDLVKASETMSDHSHLVRIPIDRDCPQCEEPLLKKLGKNGYFIGCSAFAQGCRYNESIPLGTCPLCGGNVVRKKSKKGRNFYGCEKFAETGCEFTMLDKPATKQCRKCNSIMGQKVRKNGILLTCQNTECKFQEEEVTEN